MNAPLPQHAMPLAFPVEDDSLVVGGLPLPALAARVGSTPFYAYDRAHLDERVALLRRHLPPQVKLHYAIKANPMPALVDHLARRVDGLDVASGRELRVALDSGMTAQEISFAGPGKTQAELAQAIGAGILLNVE
jgi:diaminopimelate decarboxylase